jgi:hypothetical protein
MKSSKWVVFAMLMVAFPCLSQRPSNVSETNSSSVNPGYTLTIGNTAEQFHLNAPVNIAITVKNISSDNIYWRAEFGNTGYHSFHFLLKSNGKEPETTRFHRLVRNEPRPDDQPEAAKGSGSSIVSALEPGKSFTLMIDLSKLYKITELGQYTLEVSRTQEGTKAVIHSNTVTFNVVP